MITRVEGVLEGAESLSSGSLSGVGGGSQRGHGADGRAGASRSEPERGGKSKNPWGCQITGTRYCPDDYLQPIDQDIRGARWAGRGLRQRQLPGSTTLGGLDDMRRHSALRFGTIFISGVFGVLSQAPRKRRLRDPAGPGLTSMWTQTLTAPSTLSSLFKRIRAHACFSGRMPSCAVHESREKRAFQAERLLCSQLRHASAKHLRQPDPLFKRARNWNAVCLRIGPPS